MHPHVHVHIVYAKALELALSKTYAKFEIPVISKILDRHLTEMFYYCFIETSYVVHL